MDETLMEQNRSGNRNVRIFLCYLILVLCMIINCFHSHLWGPDEPREAEIAREIFVDNSWVVPHFNGLPFVEKPPLYYDVSALIYSIFPYPGNLRIHSALLGCIMLGALAAFAAKRFGHEIALYACALCISMPQFYRAAHWILLDIGVGAWVTAGLVCYGAWYFDEGKPGKSRAALTGSLFFFFAALGMLTKGVITAVYLGTIIIPHYCFCKKRHPLPPFWTTLFFFVPVGIWLWLFYREGGYYFLHEHFVNNIIGRLLHVKFELPGSPIIVSDVGHKTPLFFYFERLPSMFGAAVAVIPFAFAWFWRVSGLPFFHWALPRNILKIWDILTKPHPNDTLQNKEILRYLVIWSFIPVFVFSIPAIKEVTYLLPSYAGLALFLICYLSDRLSMEKTGNKYWLRSFIAPLLCMVLATQTAEFSIILFFILFALINLWLLMEITSSLLHKEFHRILLPVLAILIGCVMLGNTPALLVKSKVNRKCYCLFAEYIWQKTGTRPLYTMRTDESIRGALPFYGRRNIHFLNSKEMLATVLQKDEKTAILLCEHEYQELNKNTGFRQMFQSCQVIFPEFPDKADRFVLLLTGSKRPESSN